MLAPTLSADRTNCRPIVDRSNRGQVRTIAQTASAMASDNR
jgi:hypothetical protein